MKRQFILLFSIISFLSCQNAEKNNNSNTPEELPNIVLIIGDDQGAPYFGFMGADYVQTPNMDTLAKSGTLFINGYVPDNHCRPSLQALMTGTLPIDYKKEVEKLLAEEIANKKFDSEKSQRDFEIDFRHHAMKHFITLPRYLSEKGYVSFQGGKWWEFNYHNGGFDVGMTEGWTEEEKEDGSSWFKRFMGGDGLELGRLTMEPVYEFIEENHEKPFFIWYAPELPHYPFNAAEKYYNIYKDEEMTESAKRYYANCTWFDDGVGELTKFLKEKNEFNNTLFIYVNDNGWEQNPDQEFRHDSLRWHNGGDKGKLSLYDQSFRTPIIFSWKNKIDSDKRKNHLIESADIPATILDYVGIKTPENFHGKSLKSLINEDRGNGRELIIGNSNKMRSEEDMMGKDIEGYWLRNEKYFFRWIKSEEETALYDMDTDPNNEVNLAEENSDIVNELKKEIDNWVSSKN